MSATRTLHPSKVLPFIASVVCSNCGRACGDDELSECLRCGERYCECSWDCVCDQTAREIMERAGIEVTPCE